MKNKNILILLIIGILFIGVIFFSGCTSKSSNEEKISCADFCKSKGKDYSGCTYTNINIPLCQNNNECYYKIEYFDIDKNNIICNEFEKGCKLGPSGGLTSENCRFCACMNMEYCGSTYEECSSRCNEDGCAG